MAGRAEGVMLKAECVCAKQARRNGGTGGTVSEKAEVVKP